MTPFQRSTSLFFLVIACLYQDTRRLVLVQEEEDTTTLTNILSLDCSEAGILACGETENRLCLVNVTSSEEFCGPCRAGYVDFPEAVIDRLVDSLTDGTNGDDFKTATTAEDDAPDVLSNNNRTCVGIPTLSLALFLERFQPELLEDGNATQRLERLQEVAQFVSDFNYQQYVQNGSSTSYDELALNEYATDTPEETKTLTGLQRPDDYDPNLDDTTFNPDPNAPYPSYVNWVERGAVSPVKQQGVYDVKILLL